MVLPKKEVPTKMTAQHIVLWRGEKTHEFLDVEWYDTATPYQGCARELQRLHNLAAHHALEIVSHGKSHKIANPSDFRRWVADIFEHGGDFGFAKRLLSE